MMSDLISIKKDKSTEFKNKEVAAGLQDSSPSYFPWKPEEQAVKQI